MALTTQPAALPYGIGRISPGWLLAVVVTLALIGFGAYGYSRQIEEGEIVTGLRDVGTRGGAPWGLYIAFELWAVGIGFGAMMLIGVIRLGRLTYLRPRQRAMGLLALATLFVGGWSIIADVGQPGRAIINIIRYARPMSPFFGTFTIGLVAAFSALLVWLYLDSRRDAALLAERPGKWRGLLRTLAAGYRDTPAERARRRVNTKVLAIALIVIAVAAASTSGFVFGIQQARPGWFSALQAPGFVVLAALTGASFAVIVASALRSALKQQERLDLRVFTWLNNLMMALTLVYIYFLLVELVTSQYSGQVSDELLSDEILKGEYAWMFWGSGALFIVAFVITGLQTITRRVSVQWLVLAAVLINVAAIGKRYLLVVPPLTVGRLLPYPEGSYTPTWVEWSVVIGLIGLAILFYLLVMKVFPIMEVERDS